MYANCLVTHPPTQVWGGLPAQVRQHPAGDRLGPWAHNEVGLLNDGPWAEYVQAPRNDVAHRTDPRHLWVDGRAATWRTPCGWTYGSRPCSLFFRHTSARRCLVCFSEAGAIAFGAKWPGGIPPFAQSRAYHNDAVLHKPDFNEPYGNRSEWRTPCGWIYPDARLGPGAAKATNAFALFASLKRTTRLPRANFPCAPPPRAETRLPRRGPRAKKSLGLHLLWAPCA